MLFYMLYILTCLSVLVHSKQLHKEDTKSTKQTDITDGMDEISQVYTGPVAFSFLTPTSLVLSERTYISVLDLQSKSKTLIVGSKENGGYIDGTANEGRFSFINDVVIQGNFIYIADFSCVRVYDLARKLIATLAGSCGRIEDPLTTTIIPPTFKGHLKLAVSARDLYVLDSEKISRVDRETGMTRTLSIGQYLTAGQATSIEVDKYSNVLFVAVVTTNSINVIAVDIVNGKQMLYSTIKPQSKLHKGMTAMVASLALAPGGQIYILEPTALHSLDRDTLKITSTTLEDYGYHEIAVSSRYAVLSQEFYSRMYRLHLVNISDSTETEYSQERQQTAVRSEQSREDNIQQTINVCERQTFYLAVIFPSILFLLVILVTVCATRKILRSRNERLRSQPDSDMMSEKYFLNHDNTQWI